MSKLHADLLLALRAAGQHGIGAEDLLTDMRRGRHRELTQPELERALRDLADQSFATAFTTVLKSKKWRVTALGTSALEEESL